MNDFILRTYDPKRVFINFNGIPFYNLAESFVTISQEGDSFETTEGGDGSVARTNRNPALFTITIRLLSTSVTNDALTAIHKADIESNAGHGTLFIQDSNGTTFFSGSQSWITKYPEVSFERSITEREWTFHSSNPEIFIGGNL